MKKITLLLLIANLWVNSFAQTGVGISIGIHQPGVYGRIDIGDYPPPRVIYPQPVVIVQSPMADLRQPIYLNVPPGHQKNWGKQCGRFNACGQPVYFVQEDWIRERYDAREDRDGREDRDERGRGKGKKQKNGRRD